MNIQNVQLDQNPIDETVRFLVTTEEGDTIYVPNEPLNSDYWLVREWYDQQETKPFEFQFEQTPEPQFEETIYPPEPESEEEGETEE
jgi:hypothetical protein